MSEIVIITALEREVAPLVHGPHWQKKNTSAPLRIYEGESGFIICTGIGPIQARKAAAWAAVEMRPKILVSAGLAGALKPQWKAGQVVIPAAILTEDSTMAMADVRWPILAGVERAGVLVSRPEVYGVAEKSRLAAHTSADIVDMEAATVAAVAASHGISFLAVKAISDELDFPMPDFEPFIDSEGRFCNAKFMAHAALHPRWWFVLGKLASNTNRATHKLCDALRKLLEPGVMS